MTAPPRRLPRWEALALIALTVAAFVGFFVYPTYSNYDSLYSLLWGRELLHGTLPSFDAYRAPTQHPLWVAISVPLAALGLSGDRLLLALCVASFVAMVAGMYRLGKASFGWIVGLVGALLLLSRLDFPFLAARGYIDIPYLALILWACALEAERPEPGSADPRGESPPPITAQRRSAAIEGVHPAGAPPIDPGPRRQQGFIHDHRRIPAKRGGVVWVLLTLAGLLRPEAWVLAGLYGIWLAWGRPLREWVRVGAIMSIAPVVWALSDLLVTGDPLYSLNYTTESARELGRRQSLLELPSVTFNYLSELTKPPVLIAAIGGMVLAWRMARDRALVPAVMLAWGVGVFLLVSLRGFSVISRYVLVAAIALMLFAAFAIAGWSRLPRGHRAIKPWAAGALVVVLGGVAFTALTFNPRYVNRELNLRDSVRQDLTAVLDSPQVRAGRACGPISVPNHKLVADVRWLADAGADGVVARTNPKQTARQRRGGVALFLHGGTRFLKHPAYGPFDQTEDSPIIQVPTTGYNRAKVGRYFSAYVRCRA